MGSRSSLLAALHRRRDDAVLAAYLTHASVPHAVVDTEQALEALASAPSPATLVDSVGGSVEACTRRLSRAFWHVREGGTYVLVADTAGDAQAVLEAVGRLSEAQQPDGLRVRPRLRRELRRAIGGVRRQGRLVVVEKAGPSLLKVGETETALIPLRTTTSVDVIEHRDAHRYRPSRNFSSHGPNPIEPIDELAVPAGEVRCYTGDITLHEGMVVVADTTVFPESFKWFEHTPLDNAKLRDITPRFARLRDRPASEIERLPGSFYLFEYKNSGHYGHLLTEGVAKLWGWEEARRADPTVRLAVRRHRRDRGRDVERPDSAILAAYGIGPEDVVWLEEAVRVETLFTATPQLHNKEPFSIDPRIVEVWDRLLAGLLATGVGDREPQRIFVTRRSGHRLCHNWREVESIFTDAGFVIVEPARLSLPEQAQLFRNAEMVAGFGGTGLFNLIFASQQPPVVVLNHAGYDARNEELITAARGSDLHTFWSEPDRPQPRGGFDYRAFQSSWTFDVNGHGAELRALLND